MGDELDIVLVGGVVVDGTGSPRFRGDVGVREGRIVAVGDLSGAATVRREDVSGLVVCPGFVDIHAHSDVMTLAFPEAVNKIHQGITTEVAGNCGKSMVPVRSPAVAAEVRPFCSTLDVPAVPWELTGVDEYLDRVDGARPAVSLALLAGHIPIRVSVVGLDRRPPTRNEIERMRRMLDQALVEGAVGMSLGLMSPPSSFATVDEMVALGEVLARHDALLAVHLRDYSDGLLAAVGELLGVAEAAGCRLQISHLTAVGKQNWGAVRGALAMIDAAAERGVDVAVDIYPYLAGSTHLSQTLPRWALDGGMSALRVRLADPDSRQQIAEAMGEWPTGWDDVVLGTVPSDPSLAGLTVAELAARLRRRSEDVVMDLLAESDPTMIAFGRSEDDLRTVFAHPRSMVGSDGLAVLPEDGGSLPHPRAFGTYPRFFRRYVFDEQLVSLEEGVRMCTSAPADRVRLSDRGRIAEGLRADLVVFDPDRITDTATYQAPRGQPLGMHHVIANGVSVVHDGRATGSRANCATRSALKGR